MGSKVYGIGFFLGPTEAAELLSDPRNEGVILPATGGEDVNSDPLRRAPAFVIDFGQRTLAQARTIPTALAVVESRVRPERENANEATADGAHRKKYWWQFAQPRPELYAAVAPLDRCLVTARVSKDLMVSFQPTGRVFCRAAERRGPRDDVGIGLHDDLDLHPVRVREARGDEEIALRDDPHDAAFGDHRQVPHAVLTEQRRGLPPPSRWARACRAAASSSPRPRLGASWRLRDARSAPRRSADIGEAQPARCGRSSSTSGEALGNFPQKSGS